MCSALIQYVHFWKCNGNNNISDEPYEQTVNIYLTYELFIEFTKSFHRSLDPSRVFYTNVWSSIMRDFDRDQRCWLCNIYGNIALNRLASNGGKWVVKRWREGWRLMRALLVVNKYQSNFRHLGSICGAQNNESSFASEVSDM